MLVSVSGCSSPKRCFLFSITTTSSATASFHWPCFLCVAARFAMLLSVLGCSSPKRCLLFSITTTSSASASFHWPWSLYVPASFCVCQGAPLPRDAGFSPSPPLPVPLPPSIGPGPCMWLQDLLCL